LRLLAQTSKTRSLSLPDVPTYEEAGIKGLVARFSQIEG
jgi:tripartite-type tricarboxylate transporter receptor subunit TctC